MQLPTDRWTDEELVRITIRWRNNRRKITDVFTIGESATLLWLSFTRHLNNRFRDLLNMTMIDCEAEVVTLESRDVIKLSDIDTIWIEDNQGREFIFERYGSESFLASP